MKNEPRGSGRCQQKNLKHTAPAKGPDPKLRTSSLEANVAELAHQLHALQLENETLKLRRTVLTGMWLASRQAVKLLEASQWGSTEDVQQALTTVQDLETICCSQLL
jgi:hypothetical protein